MFAVPPAGGVRQPQEGLYSTRVRVWQTIFDNLQYIVKIKLQLSLAIKPALHEAAFRPTIRYAVTIMDEPMFEEIPQDDVPSEPDTEQDQQDEELKLYRKALEEEFLASASVSSQRRTAKETKEQINELIPEALSGLKRLIKFADRDATKLRACTWVLENALSLKGLANTDDPLVDLIEGMSTASTTPQQQED